MDTKNSVCIHKPRYLLHPNSASASCPARSEEQVVRRRIRQGHARPRDALAPFLEEEPDGAELAVVLVLDHLEDDVRIVLEHGAAADRAVLAHGGYGDDGDLLGVGDRGEAPRDLVDVVGRREARFLEGEELHVVDDHQDVLAPRAPLVHGPPELLHGPARELPGRERVVDDRQRAARPPRLGDDLLHVLAADRREQLHLRELLRVDARVVVVQGGLQGQQPPHDRLARELERHVDHARLRQGPQGDVEAEVRLADAPGAVDEHELVPEAVERLLEGEGMDGDPALVAHEYRGEVVEEVLDALQVRGGERGRHHASPPLAICPLRKS